MQTIATLPENASPRLVSQMRATVGMLVFSSIMLVFDMCEDTTCVHVRREDAARTIATLPENALRRCSKAANLISECPSRVIDAFCPETRPDVLPADASRGEDADAVPAREHHRPQGHHLREPGGQIEGEFALRELPDMMSAKFSDFLTPSPVVRIWN